MVIEIETEDPLVRRVEIRRDDVESGVGRPPGRHIDPRCLDLAQQGVRLVCDALDLLLQAISVRQSMSDAHYLTALVIFEMTLDGSPRGFRCRGCYENASSLYRPGRPRPENRSEDLDLWL